LDLVPVRRDRDTAGTAANDGEALGDDSVVEAVPLIASPSAATVGRSRLPVRFSACPFWKFQMAARTSGPRMPSTAPR
jgi:hypothetical protein